MEESPRRLILIADPDSRLRGEIREALWQDGFDVAEAATGEEALAKFDKRKPCAVLLEVELPDMSGLDVCRDMRRHGDALPIILISSRAEEVDVVVGLEIGADDYVTKPVRLRVLTARVAENLRRTSVDGQDLDRVRVELKDLVIEM